MPEADTGHTIDLMIAGAQKAGTSSPKAMLAQHPEVGRHTPLECDYFLDPAGRDWPAYCARFFQPAARRVVAKQAYLTRTDAAGHANTARVARFPGLRRRADRLRSSPAFRSLKDRLPYPVVKRLRDGLDSISLRQDSTPQAVELSHEDRARLTDYYARKNRGFTALTGVDLPW